MSSNASLLSDYFDVYANKLLSEWGVPGLAVGVIRLKDLGKVEAGKEEVQVDFRNYGYATMPGDGGKGEPITENTLFGIASNTKAFTAASIAKLVEDGKLEWSTPVATLLPNLSFKDPVANAHANAVDLLAHRTGLPRHEHAYQVGESQDELVQRVMGLIPSAEFRAYNQYNNQMFVTAAAIVKELSGTSFTSYVTDNFLKPLSMHSSTFRPYPSPDLASSYITLEDNSLVEIPYHFNFDDVGIELAAGAGGLVSCSKDMVKWMEFLIRQRHAGIKAARSGGEEPKTSTPNAPISASSVLELTKSHAIGALYSQYSEESAETYGMGFRFGHYQGEEFIRHGGDVPGFGSQVAWSAEKGIGVVTLANAADSGNAVAGLLTYRVFEELLGLKQVDWNTRYREKHDKGRSEQAERRTKWKSPSTAEKSDFSRFHGKYHDASYGEVTVLSPTGDHDLHRKIAASKVGSPPPGSSDLLIYAPGFFGISHAVLQRSSEKDEDVFRALWALYYEPSKGSEGLLIHNCHTPDFEVRFKVEGGKVVGMEWSKGAWGAGNEVSKRDNEGRTEVAFTKV